MRNRLPRLICLATFSFFVTDMLITTIVISGCAVVTSSSFYDETENNTLETANETDFPRNSSFHRLLRTPDQSEYLVDVLAATIREVSFTAFHKKQNVFVMCAASVFDCNSWMDLLPLKDHSNVTFTLSSAEPGATNDRSLVDFDVMILLAWNSSSILTVFLPEKALTWNGNAAYIVILLDEVINTSYLLRRLWKQCWIYRSVLLQLSQPQSVSTFDVIRKTTLTFSFTDSSSVQHVFQREFINLHGEKVRIILFAHEPTSTLIRKEDPSSIESYIGLDVSMIYGFSEFLNFKIKVQGTSDKVKYGEVLPNGTLSGTVKDLAFRKGDIAFNGHFIIDFIGRVEFSTQYSVDSVCVVVPKAGYIPKWRSILKPFDLPFVIATAISICLLAATVKLARRLQRDLSKCDIDMAEIVSVLVSMPQPKLPKKAYHRIIVLACDMWSIVVVGGFQGILVNTLTVPLAFPDINTLDELAASKLHIFSSYKTMNLFPIVNSTVHKQLNRSLVFVNEISDYIRSGKERFAWTGKKSNLYMKVKAVHHIVKECPQSYFLSYMVTAGSPFLERLNRYIQLLHAGGLVYLWEKHKNNTALPENSSVAGTAGADYDRELTVQDLEAPFLLLAICLVFSACVLVGEIVKKRLEMCLQIMRNKSKGQKARSRK